MLKAVVFDLDGTLLDTIPDIAGALNRALEQCGLPTHPVRRMESFVGGGIREAIYKAAPAGADEGVLEQVYQLYRVDYPAHCTEKTAPFPGVEQALSALEQAGLAMGVLSNKTEATTQRIIAHFFPDIPFRFVLGRVDGRPLKPDAAAGEPIWAALGLPPGEIAYVGDSGTDVAFARATGMAAAAVSWGYRSREELAGADILADSWEEMAAGLLALGG